jgi:hypothetical protein
MTYLVKALTAAKAVDISGKQVLWAANQLGLVADQDIVPFQNNTAAWSVLAGPDLGNVLRAMPMSDAGAAATGVTATDAGVGEVHKTVISLNALAMTLTDVAATGQWGAAKLYDFPTGNIMVLGAVVDADITLVETWWVDNITGSMGVGTAPNTDATTIATTRQNIVAVTNIAALAAQVGPINAQSTAALVTGAAGTTDADAYLNVKIADNAAHCPDLVSNGTFASDTVWSKGKQ